MSCQNRTTNAIDSAVGGTHRRTFRSVCRTLGQDKTLVMTALIVSIQTIGVAAYAAHMRRVTREGLNELHKGGIVAERGLKLYDSCMFLTEAESFRVELLATAMKKPDEPQTDRVFGLYAVVQANIRYDENAGKRMMDGTLPPRSIVQTIDEGMGDCDEQARVLAGLLLKDGNEVRLAVYEDHAFTQVRLDGRYEELVSAISSTLARRYGLDMETATALAQSGITETSTVDDYKIWFTVDTTAQTPGGAYRIGESAPKTLVDKRDCITTSKVADHMP